MQQKAMSNLKEIINNPKNYSTFNGLISANDKEHLKELIQIGQKLFGNDGNFNWIDTSEITDMSYLFGVDRNSIDFNGHIELWDVGNVINMRGMFHDAYEFNQPIGNWDVSNVTDMQGMFCGAKKFNQPIGGWDVSNVTNSEGMFEDCESMQYINIPTYFQL